MNYVIHNFLKVQIGKHLKNTVDIFISLVFPVQYDKTQYLLFIFPKQSN
jgi:hypothetical protein